MPQSARDGWRAGAVREDITCYIEGIGMLGWVTPSHVVRGQEAPLYARAVVLEVPRTGQRLALVSVEYAMVTTAIRLGVLERLQKQHPKLGFNEHNVHLTANHTHSAPGGYSEYLMYNTCVPGWCQRVYDTYVDGVIRAILRATERLTPAVLHYAHGEFDPDVPVGFNRMLEAYNLNRDVQKLPPEQWHLAIDRRMDLLRIDTAEGQPLASINWFGVHTTSMHHDQHRISPDNKGWAARHWEAEMAAQGHPDYVAAFAQATAGDVTPNYILHPGDYFRRGISRNDEESMAFNGQLQLDHARALWQAAAQTPAIPAQLESMTAWADLSKVRIHPDYADGATYETTGPASIGVNLVLGTAEGNGIAAEVPQLVQLLAAFTGARRPETHGDRGLLMDTGGHGLLGLGGLDPELFPAAAHPIIAEYQWLARRGMLQPRRFLPNVLPLQWVRIGPLLLLSLPGEPTTHAGRRIRQAAQTTLEALEQSGELAPGLERVIVAGYSNGFAGYITTREEYSRQLYEGSHTLFGKYTTAAYCTLYRTMVGQLARPHYERRVPFTATPQRIPWAVIDRMRWEEWTGKKT